MSHFHAIIIAIKIVRLSLLNSPLLAGSLFHGLLFQLVVLSILSEKFAYYSEQLENYPGNLTAKSSTKSAYLASARTGWQTGKQARLLLYALGTTSSTLL